jgi:hypothetical protein
MTCSVVLHQWFLMNSKQLIDEKLQVMLITTEVSLSENCKVDVAGRVLPVSTMLRISVVSCCISKTARRVAPRRHPPTHRAMLRCACRARSKRFSNVTAECRHKSELDAECKANALKHVAQHITAFVAPCEIINPLYSL